MKAGILLTTALAAISIVSTGCAHTRERPSRAAPPLVGGGEKSVTRVRNAQPPPLPPEIRPGQLRDSIFLFWDYPEEGDDTLSFNLWHKDSLPLISGGGWNMRTNIPGTERQIVLPIEPGVHFFTLTASNLWGESGFSNVASTPAPPRSDVELGIKSGATH